MPEEIDDIDCEIIERNAESFPPTVTDRGESWNPLANQNSAAEAPPSDEGELAEAFAEQVKQAQDKVEPKKEDWKPRELGSPIAGFIEHKVMKADSDGSPLECILYAPISVNPKQAQRIWTAATKPAEQKYTAGMLRPPDRVIPQVLEPEDRGVNIFTPIPRTRRIRRSIARWLNNLSGRVYSD